MSFAVVKSLFVRDLRILFVQPSRIAGTLAQPLLFWLVLGAGLAPSFRMPGAENGPGYMEFFFPGVVVMMVLMTSISSTMSVIEDRHQGFLQGVLAAPGSPASVALGKTLGGAAVGFLQAVLLLLLSPLAGYHLLAVNWFVAILATALTSIAFTAAGFVIAWRMDSSAGYHVMMSVVLLPLWVLSGALFPMDVGSHPVLAWIGRLNPMSWSVRALRDGLTAAPLGSWTLSLGILAAVTLATVAAAAKSTQA